VRPHLHRVVLETLRGAREREAPPAAAVNDRLLARLEMVKQDLAARNLPYRSPALLLSLLSLPSGFAESCLERIRPGLADAVRRSIQHYLDETLPATDHKGFQPFEWSEREELRSAQSLATAGNAPAVTERHLLLALLRGQNAAADSLKALAGGDYQKLIEVVERTPSPDPAAPATPDILINIPADAP
jgi:ATP-dependent Clp protease ATP-binding subunit ClpA